MFLSPRSAARVLIRAACVLAPIAAQAQIDVATERYDDARLGANLQETQLNTTNVNVSSFGKLWSYTVSGSVYAQPLYVRNVDIAGGTHNVLYVVTMNDIVYAFDADSSVDAPLLSLDLTSEVAGAFPPCILDVLGFNDNIIGNVGIESTPVIDVSAGTIYLVSRFEHTDNGQCGGSNRTFTQSLHALDMSTLNERPGSPVVLGGSVACHPGAGGSGCSDNGNGTGTLTFNSQWEDQRSSLALSNGRVFIAWSGHSDQGPYHGWVMAYDASTLQQTMIWSAAPDGTSFNGAGIWMAGRAPAIDADGNVYYVTGNGTWDGVTNFGESFVKFGATPDTPLVDWFTPSDWNSLNGSDADLGGSGPILVPGSTLIASAGKSGTFYVTDTTAMGHEGDTNAVQVFDNGNGGKQIKGGAVYWNRADGLGPWMYVWSDDCNHFNAYHFNGATFDETPISQSTLLSPCGSSGGVLTLSADASNAGSGVVWASIPTSGDANSGVHPGTLRAFDADNLDTELWNSNQNQSRDNAGNWPKFSPPTVVNGRVYLGSFPTDGVSDTLVNVYGLLTPDADFALSATPPNPGVNPGGSVTYTISLAATNGFSSSVHLAASSLPTGATATFESNDLTPPAETTLTIDVDAAVAPGEYAFSIDASSGALQHSVDAAFYVTDAAAGAGTIGIDFAGSGRALAATGVAGFIPKPNWNIATGASGNDLALFDESAADTGATASWQGGGTGALGLAEAAPDFAMMDGYLDANATTTTLTIANLPAYSGGYFVYVYADGNNGATSVAGDYVLSGDDGQTSSARIVDAANATFDGTFVPVFGNGSGNYAVLFTGGTNMTLTVTSSSNGGGPHVPLNGIQIVRGDRIFGDGFD